MRKRSGEIVGWKFPPSGWYPQIGLDHVYRGRKELKEYVENGELARQQTQPMKRKTGKIKRKKVNGKWVVIE